MRRIKVKKHFLRKQTDSKTPIHHIDQYPKKKSEKKNRKIETTRSNRILKIKTKKKKSEKIQREREDLREGGALSLDATSLSFPLFPFSSLCFALSLSLSLRNNQRFDMSRGWRRKVWKWRVRASLRSERWRVRVEIGDGG